MKSTSRLFVLLTVLTSLLLSACNDEKNESEEKPEVNKPQEENVVIPALTDEAFFEQVHKKLETAGFEVSEPMEADVELFGAVSGMTLIVNKEALMPLNLYKLSPSDERLSEVDKTGYLEVTTETKHERLAAKRKDHFIIYLHKGHPDYEKVMEVLDEL
ncbi:hypothetical protein ABZ756_04095 [Mammaliicoccus sciuri]|uniref:Lipoprotein n=1 Tax=Sporosarcina newyorkensis TaxID=759851 RepID=A0A1T4XPR8_9BACL|nr:MULTISPECIES: hypothetical protein [Sporosarcina]MBY0222410.1 hypothetical protein [Sporosarcina aquimarina]SKA91517.1 hypothetical protein SAMN04244570_1154 [Sporosarcina newyorkensis]